MLRDIAQDYREESYDPTCTQIDKDFCLQKAETYVRAANNIESLMPSRKKERKNRWTFYYT